MITFHLLLLILVVVDGDVAVVHFQLLTHFSNFLPLFTCTIFEFNNRHILSEPVHQGKVWPPRDPCSSAIDSNLLITLGFQQLFHSITNSHHPCNLVHGTSHTLHCNNFGMENFEFFFSRLLIIFHFLIIFCWFRLWSLLLLIFIFFAQITLNQLRTPHLGHRSNMLRVEKQYW